MSRRVLLLAGAGALVLLAALLLLRRGPGAEPPIPSPSAATAEPSPARPAPRPMPTPDPRDADLFGSAAGDAWHYVQSHVERATGFVAAVERYHYATVWDIASGLAALFCARELGLLEPAAYDALMARALSTLRGVDLFDDVAYNKAYSTSTGRMVGRDDRPSARGGGWSITDLGRLLIWLKIISTHHPDHAAAAEAVVRRMDARRLVRGGYLWGAQLSGGGLREFQEGRLGYEQYAAEGFRAWGFPVERALDFAPNVVPISVGGRRLAADLRAYDRLTSEPFVLLGLEVGWAPGIRALADELLAAQEDRYRRTGRVTVVSEDAISRPPHFFYYYCVYTKGREFAIDVQDPRAVVAGPRWVSTKASYAWHALLPGAYTRRAVEAVSPSRTPRGWGSGVYEADGRSTGTINVNTQAVILEAALYHRRGRPLLARGGAR